MMGKKDGNQEIQVQNIKETVNDKKLKNFDPEDKLQLIALYDLMKAGEASDISNRMGSTHHKVSSKQRPHKRVEEYTETRPLEVALRMYTDCTEPDRTAKQIAKSKIWDSVKLQKKMMERLSKNEMGKSIDI
jgi:hypothetical protein